MRQFLRFFKRNLSDLKADLWQVIKRTSPGTQDVMLMYHGVDAVNSLEYNFRHVGIRYFEKHVKFIKKHYEVVTVPIFFSTEKFERPKCCITFDDGYKNNLEYALPILEKHQCPATIYITATNKYGKDYLWSDMLDLLLPYVGDSVTLNQQTYYRSRNTWYQPFLSEQGENFHEAFKKLPYHQKCNFFERHQSSIDAIKSTASCGDYWKLMSDDEIKTIAKSKYIQIGSHGVYHNNLGYIPLSQAIEEMKKSKEYLESLIGRPVNSIAYPDGSYSDEVIQEAEKIGYQYQIAVAYKAPHHLQDPRIQDRIGIYAFESLAQQYSKILNK